MEKLLSSSSQIHIKIIMFCMPFEECWVGFKITLYCLLFPQAFCDHSFYFCIVSPLIIKIKMKLQNITQFMPKNTKLKFFFKQSHNFPISARLIVISNRSFSCFEIIWKFCTQSCWCLNLCTSLCFTKEFNYLKNRKSRAFKLYWKTLSSVASTLNLARNVTNLS